MIGFFLLTVPIFGVVALGWGATRMRMMSADSLEALAAFSFRFALPALVFRLIAVQPLNRVFDVTFFAGYLASGSLLFSIVFGMSCYRKRSGLASAAARATTATVSNVGFLGPPVVLTFFGERGAGALAMVILVEVMLLMSLGASIMGGSSKDGRRSFGFLLLRNIILNPVIAAIALGGIAATLSLALPQPLDRFLGFLGAAAGPTALFALGGALALQRIDHATISVAAGITVAKLFAYPAFVWFMLSFVLKVEPFWNEIGVLIAALPSAGSNYVLAQRYAAEVDQVSAGIMLSTVVSIATVPVAAWLIFPGT
ncbi:malonate transporter [Nitrobacteraceae bacterium AZCC 1564]